MCSLKCIICFSNFVWSVIFGLYRKKRVLNVLWYYTCQLIGAGIYRNTMSVVIPYVFEHGSLKKTGHQRSKIAFYCSFRRLQNSDIGTMEMVIIRYKRTWRKTKWTKSATVETKNTQKMYPYILHREKKLGVGTFYWRYKNTTKTIFFGFTSYEILHHQTMNKDKISCYNLFTKYNRQHYVGPDILLEFICDDAWKVSALMGSPLIWMIG